MERTDKHETGDRGRRIELDVSDGAAGQRLDAWLAGALVGSGEALSRSRLQALIRGGRLRIGGSAATEPRTKLRGGERIALDIPPPVPALPEPELMPLDILHEDGEVIVLVKPAGLVVHPGAGVRSGTLVNALLAHCGASLSGIGGVARPGIVHRLDRDTSGVMVVAKTDRAHQALSAQFADHGRTGPMERRYEALVWGRPTPPAGRIDLPLGRDARDRTRRAVSRASDARQAATRYETVEGLPEAAHIACRLETGRTHQIRVHMEAIGHPLLGDPTYGASHRSKVGRLDAAARDALAWLPGQALHAASLAFAHPTRDETMRFEAPPPPAFLNLLDALRDTAS